MSFFFSANANLFMTLISYWYFKPPLLTVFCEPICPGAAWDTAEYFGAPIAPSTREEWNTC